MRKTKNREKVRGAEDPIERDAIWGSSRLHLLKTRRRSWRSWHHCRRDMTSDNLTTTSRSIGAPILYAALVDKRESGLISGRAKFHEGSRLLTRLPIDCWKGALVQTGPRSSLASTILRDASFRARNRWCEKRCNPVINTPCRSNFRAIILSRV